MVVVVSSVSILALDPGSKADISLNDLLRDRCNRGGASQSLPSYHLVLQLLLNIMLMSHHHRHWPSDP